MVKRTVKRFSEYPLTPQPGTISAYAAKWRRTTRSPVETEIVKPESFLPVSTGASSGSPICFTIKAVPHSYIDGRNIFVEVNFDIEELNAEGEWVTTTRSDKVAPLANVYCSVFEDLNVSFNGVLVENTQRDFALKAYMQNLLYSSVSDKNMWLGAGLFNRDTAGAFDRMGALSVFPSATKRMWAGSQYETVQTYGRLMSDILNSDSPIPDNVTITIKLFPAKSEACLVQDLTQREVTDPVTGAKKNVIPDPETYRVIIKDCSLYVPRIHMPSMTKSLNNPFTYSNWRLLSYTHQKDQASFKKDLAVGETLPQRALVAFMTESAYNGTWDTNKNEFSHFDASNVLMKCNQKHLPFMNGYHDLMFTGKNLKYGPAYCGLLTEGGAVGCDITHNEYRHGFTIFAFDLTPDKCADMILDKPNKGALELSVDFSKPPGQNIIVLAFLIYASRFEIAKSGAFSRIE
jgi:hypothetical protein